MAWSEQHAVNNGRRIILRPNASLTRRQAFVFFIGMTMGLTTIAGGFAIMGAWLILPFCGAELLLLGYCLYTSMQRSSVCEVITITEKWVKIEKGRYKLEQRYEFIKGWTTIDLERPLIKGYPSRLSVRSQGKQIEIGQFLVESERKALALELKKALA